MTVDDSSPDYPCGTAYHRTSRQLCLSMPSEGNDVIEVSALGPSQRKAYYSDYGKHIDVAAPGGDVLRLPGTPEPASENLIAPPTREAGFQWGDIGDLTATGCRPRRPSSRGCESGTCAYYQYLQGTSMASPHAVGVAALIVSKYGQTEKSGPKS